MENLENKVVKKNIPNQIVGSDGSVFPSIRKLAKKLRRDRDRIAASLNNSGHFYCNGVTYVVTDTPKKAEEKKCEEKVEEKIKTVVIEKVREDEDEYQEFKKMKDEIKSLNDIPIENYNFKIEKHKNGSRYCIALFSDVHLEETVEKESVLGKNEYNLTIAKERVKNYFNNLALCINDDRVETVIFACLGDIINGVIHESYLATNSLMPMEAVSLGQSLIYSGLKFLVNNTTAKKILFIGVIGNHSRTTKKIWSSGAYKMSYEYLLYKNIQNLCELENLPIEFIIPNSDKALLSMNDGNLFLFEHGDAIRSTGQGVCGIYPALGRYSLKISKTINQTKLFIGHFHQCTQMNGVTVNGSVVGQDNYALRNGFAPERPAQMYEVYDSNIGLLNTRQIYCD